MKKILVLLLSLLLALSVLSACGTVADESDKDDDIKVEENDDGVNDAEKDNEAEETQGSENKTENENDNNEDTSDQTNQAPRFKVLSCEYKEMITGTDFEYYGEYYPDKEGKTYVDLRVEVINTTDSDLKYEDFYRAFSGYIVYDEVRYDFQTAVESVGGTAVESTFSAIIASGETRIVHMFTSVSDDVKKEPLKASYNLYGNSGEILVSEDSLKYTLDDKIKVSVGDVINIDDMYEIEIVSCKIKKVLTANDYANSVQLSGLKPFLELLIKMKNKTETPLYGITSYSVIGDDIIRGDLRIDIDNNTNIGFLSQYPLNPGQEEYVHILTTVEEGTTQEGLSVRFNFNNKCYYCEAE